MASLCEDHSSRIRLSYRSLWGIWCKLRLREDRGENPLDLKVCLRSMDEAENRNRGVVQKRSVEWKSPPDSGTVDSDWYGLCSNLAQFTLHSSWHILGYVNFVLVSPDVRLHSASALFITRERVLLCGCTLWRHRESIQSAYGLLERLSSFFVVLLICRFAYVYCRLKKPCETWNQ